MDGALRTEPKLSDTEWMKVAEALDGVFRCGCSGTGKPGISRRILKALAGRPRKQGPADTRSDLIRAFVCQSRRDRRIARSYVPALRDLGFNDRQVDALAIRSI